MNALLNALANLARLRWLGVAFCALAIVCATTNVNANAIASGTQHEQAKTRVGGFEQNSPLNVCANSLASAETHRGISSAQCETASAFSHAAKGGASGIKALLEGLGLGKNAAVRVVKSAEELESLFAQMSAGGKVVEGSSYPGKLIELGDKTTVGLRSVSKTGGPTIDITLPGGKLWKVHVE